MGATMRNQFLTYKTRKIFDMVNFLLLLFVVFSIGMAAFTFSKCGSRTLMLGNGVSYAAFSGMCDN
jgi:hypothetical protein